MTPDLVWSEGDSSTASEEGWDLFDVNGHGYLEIERIDEADAFADDAEALSFVRAKAAEGCALHLRALAIHDTYEASATRPKL